MIGPSYWTRAIRLAVAALLGVCAFFWQAAASIAHEVRPSYLELREYKAGEFDALLKTPMQGDRRLALAPTFSARTEVLTPTVTVATGSAAVQTWRFRLLEPLRGTILGIDGLESTTTDALVRIVFLDGTSWVHRLTPQEPSTAIPAVQSSLSVADVYLRLGIEHILLGIDHLVFVLALLILARGTWRLVKTVTAFTLAHSLTLALATLGYVHVPPAPVEAVIALSIVFVAMEIIRLREGHEGLTAKAPWVVAFTFGLLHGLGFAGALSEVGLPEKHVPLALLFFNVGVEIGQLVFIATALSFISVLMRVRSTWPRWADLVAPYTIGSIAMFWVIERASTF